ncbi:FUSC family protein [Chthoniobacter flavus]|nr:FUSC family protein [Chthoniobacter flavus]
MSRGPCAVPWPWPSPGSPGLYTGHPAAILVAAPTAQNVAMLDARGDYRARLGILLTLTLVLSLSALTGTIGGNHVLTATLLMGVFGLLAGVWRHLSGDYGPNFALTSGLLYFLALTSPGDWAHAGTLFLATGLAGLVGIVIQLSGWFVRPQHPLRYAVAETWVAASDLITAMRRENDDGQPIVSDIGEKEGALRSTVDRTLQAITATAHQPGLAQHFDDTAQLAARVATRTTALYSALEAIESRPGFAAISPTVDSTLRSLVNALRSAAVTIITHRPGQFIALQVRLRRAADLLQVLDARLAALSPADAELAQVRHMLAQLTALLPQVRTNLQETVDHGEPQAGFALRLPELGGMSMRALGAWLNPSAQLDWTLVRYTLRVTVVLMFAVAIYKGFDIPRGHWIGFTSLVVLQPDYGATRQKLGQRLLGTFTGSILASLLLWLKLPVAGAIFGASVMAFCFAYFVRRRYWLAIFFVTIMIVLMGEASSSVHLDLPIARSLSNLAGGVLALVAALLFWPQWEQEQSPQILATALRTNRAYLEAVAAHFRRGERFIGSAVLTKRAAERANSQASASLQRLVSEPARVQRGEQRNLERIATLTTYNQRLTRAIGVLAQHLNPNAGSPIPSLEAPTEKIAQRLESLAQSLETGQRPAPIPPLDIPTPTGPTTDHVLIYRQLRKIITEIDALALAEETKPDSPE